MPLWGVHLNQVCLMVICLFNSVTAQKMYADQSLYACCCFPCVILLLLQQQTQHQEQQQQQKDWVIDNWTEMYVDCSFCSCCCFSCVILLLLQQHNYTVTTQTTTTKRFSYWSLNRKCTRLIFLFLLLCFFMCPFVVAATTQLHSNNNNNKQKNNNNQQIQLLLIEQKIYVGWSFCSYCCSFSCAILLLLQQHNYTVTTTATATTATKRSLYINVLINSRTHTYWITHLTSWQCDPKDNQMSRWPDAVPFLATRCLYWGVHLTWVCLTVNVRLTLHVTVNVKLTWHSAAPDHQMPLLGGYVWLNLSLTQSITQCQVDLM